jgi:hypothetical protein
VDSFWGHAMSKGCQYAMDDFKVCASLISVSIKEAQSILQKPITWTKKWEVLVGMAQNMFA